MYNFFCTDFVSAVLWTKKSDKHYEQHVMPLYFECFGSFIHNLMLKTGLDPFFGDLPARLKVE